MGEGDSWVSQAGRGVMWGKLSCGVEPKRGCGGQVKDDGQGKSRGGGGGWSLCVHMCVHACVHMCAESSQGVDSVISLHFFGWGHLARNCHP